MPSRTRDAYSIALYLICVQNLNHGSSTTAKCITRTPRRKNVSIFGPTTTSARWKRMNVTAHANLQSSQSLVRITLKICLTMSSSRNFYLKIQGPWLTNSTPARPRRLASWGRTFQPITTPMCTVGSRNNGPYLQQDLDRPPIASGMTPPVFSEECTTRISTDSQQSWNPPTMPIPTLAVSFTGQSNQSIRTFCDYC
jgi:hypothetical protein